MNVEVTRDEIIIKEDSKQTHENEYNITTCYFTFDEFTNSFENKYAVFTLISNGISYQQDIINNQCEIPAEVLKHEYETIKLGVFGENIDNTGTSSILEDRFSPSYATFIVNTGSYKEGAITPEIITPSQYEIYSAELQEGLDKIDDKIEEIDKEVDDKIEEVDEAIARTNNLDIEAEKVDKTTTITITRKDGTPEEVEILDGVDGVSLENIEIVDRNLKVTYGGETENLGQVAPNIQIGTTTTGLPNTNASVVNVGTDLNPILNFTIPKGDAGAIKMIIVDELPATGQEDTIYLVPLEEPESQENKYAEYVYINNAWELLGKIGIEVDLTDYYTKTETNTLLNGKVGFTDYASTTTAGVIKISYESGATRSDGGYMSARTWTYTQYQNTGNGSFISKGTLENVITGKGLITNTVNNLTNYYDKTYIDNTVGNIESILETLDIGSGV